MNRTPVAVVVVIVMAAVIVAVDVLFLRHHFWPRLIANVGIVAIVAVLYLRLRSRL